MGSVTFFEKFASEDHCCIWGIASAIQLMIHQKNGIVLGISMVPTFCIFSDLFSLYGTKQRCYAVSLLVCKTSTVLRVDMNHRSQYSRLYSGIHNQSIHTHSIHTQVFQITQ